MSVAAVSPVQAGYPSSWSLAAVHDEHVLARSFSVSRCGCGKSYCGSSPPAGLNEICCQIGYCWWIVWRCAYNEIDRLELSPSGLCLLSFGSHLDACESECPLRL